MSERPAGSAFLSDWYVWVTLLSLSLSSSLFWASSEGGREGGGGTMALSLDQSANLVFSGV